MFRSKDTDSNPSDKIKELVSNRIFERGFQKLWDSVPSNNNQGLPPPAEYYDQIAASFYNKQEGDLINAMNDFSTFLFQNGFDDPQEFSEKHFLEILYQLCEIPNLQISQTAFHIFSLLLSRGPRTIEDWDVPFFINFCFRYLTDPNAPIFYYAFVCIIDVCCDSIDYRNEILSRIPINQLEILLNNPEDSIKEAALDLALQYTSFPLEQEHIRQLITLCRKSSNLNLKCLYHSTFWILIRIIRYYEEFTFEVLTDDFITRCEDLLECDSSYEILPALLFVSYSFEMKVDYPVEGLNRIVDILADPPDNATQRQACLTLTKIIFRKPELILMFVKYGVFGQIGFALDHAKFVDKILIGKLACMMIINGGSFARIRILQTKSINLFIQFFEYEEDELTFETLEAINLIFETTSEDERFEGLMKRFLSNGGEEAISYLMESENENISGLAQFIHKNYLENE